MTAGYQPIVENKTYPRERSRELDFRGRIRVQLRKDDGSPFIDKFTTRESVMEHLGQMIPQLKSRQQGKSGSGQENQPAQAGEGIVYRGRDEGAPFVQSTGAAAQV